MAGEGDFHIGKAGIPLPAGTRTFYIGNVANLQEEGGTGWHGVGVGATPVRPNRQVASSREPGRAQEGVGRCAGVVGRGGWA